MKTIEKKIEELEERRNKIEKRYDRAIEIIDDKIADLQKISCRTCEGSGEFRYREFYEKCNDCNGTGEDINKQDNLYDEWRDNQ